MTGEIRGVLIIGGGSPKNFVLQTEPQIQEVLGIDERGHDFKDFLNPGSLRTLRDCRLEPALAEAGPGSRFQFERLGYFVVDGPDSAAGRPVFNRVVSLRDSWAKAGRNS